MTESHAPSPPAPDPLTNTHPDCTEPAIPIFRLHAPAYLAEQLSGAIQHAPDDTSIAGNSSIVVPPEASASDESKTTSELRPNPVVMIRAEFELHSESQNQPTVIDSIELPSNMPPLEFRHAILDAMGLDADTAQLTCSITGQVGKATTYSFNTLSQVEDAKQNVLGAGSSAGDPIDVGSPPSPKFTGSSKIKRSSTESVIVISSDSDSELVAGGLYTNSDEDRMSLDSDSDLPEPSELATHLITTASQDRLLLALLDELDENFPGHNFISYIELFDNLDIVYVRDLADRDLTWLLVMTDMEEPSAMILMGVALSEQMLRNRPFQSASNKGKGKSKL